MPLCGAPRRRSVAGGQGQFAVAGSGIALGHQPHGDLIEVGPFQERRRHAARPFFHRDLAIDGAARQIEAHVGRELARRSVAAIAGEPHAALVQIGGQQAVAPQRPARIDLGDRRRKMQCVDRQ